MTWYTTTLEGYTELAAKLNELQAVSHTIFSVVNVSGKVVIISNTTP